MKKLLVSLLVALSLVTVSNVKADVDLPELTDHEKVTVYLFRSSTCQHCHDFLTYFAENYYKYQDYFEIVSYEVSADGNADLMYDVKDYFEETALGSIPYIVIGDYDQLGFGNTDAAREEIITQARNAYQDDSYEDVVAPIIAESDYSLTAETLEEACQSSNIRYSDGETSEEGLSDGAIVAIIFAVIIVGFGSLVLFSRQQKKN